MAEQPPQAIGWEGHLDRSLARAGDLIRIAAVVVKGYQQGRHGWLLFVFSAIFRFVEPLLTGKTNRGRVSSQEKSRPGSPWVS